MQKNDTTIVKMNMAAFRGYICILVDYKSLLQRFDVSKGYIDHFH